MRRVSERMDSMVVVVRDMDSGEDEDTGGKASARMAMGRAA